MAMLSDTELATLRQAGLVYLKDTVTLYRRSGQSGTYGYRQSTYDGGTALAALVVAPSAGQLAPNAAGQIGSLTLWQVHFPYGTKVGLNDKIAVGDQNLYVHNDLSPCTAAIYTSVLAAENKEAT